MKQFAAMGLLFLALGGPAMAQDTQNGLVISKAWSRATPSASSSAVVYFTVIDKGAPDRLTGASTPIAAEAKLHSSSMDNGVMKMRPVDGIDVSEQAPINLAPGGYHLMLTGMRQPLKTGDKFPLTLIFKHAGSISTIVEVESPGAARPADDMAGMKMDQ